MKIVVVAEELLKEELLAQGVQDNTVVEWVKEVPASGTADCYIDLLFISTPQRTEALEKLQPAIIMVNAVTTTLDHLPENFVRINGWPGFLKRSLVEAACHNPLVKAKAEEIIAAFNKTTEWVPDKAGFITATIISMIINEAFFALDEKVSSKAEIDIAMKLGTNYPFGPFEWAEKIGINRVAELLSTLAVGQPRYKPSGLLLKEVVTA